MPRGETAMPQREAARPRPETAMPGGEAAASRRETAVPLTEPNVSLCAATRSLGSAIARLGDAIHFTRVKFASLRDNFGVPRAAKRRYEAKNPRSQGNERRYEGNNRRSQGSKRRYEGSELRYEGSRTALRGQKTAFPGSQTAPCTSLTAFPGQRIRVSRVTKEPGRPRPDTSDPTSFFGARAPQLPVELNRRCRR
jgi:hypothetical protein